MSPMEHKTYKAIEQEHKADESAANMTKLPTAQELNLENLSIKTAPSVTLKPEQEVVVGSVLDVSNP